MSIFVKSLSATAIVGLIGVSLLTTSSAQAQQYCQKKWSPARGDYLDCSFSPSPGAGGGSAGGCRWTWSPSRGNYQVCGRYPGL
jgi:hypothetical protein